MSDQSHPHPLTPLPWSARCLTACWAVFLALSIFALMFSVLAQPVRPNALGWRTCVGQVLDARVERIELAGGAVRYEPRVRYQYHPGDRLRTSTRVQDPPRRFRDEAAAQEWLQRYPLGAAVTVYYRNRLEGYPLLDRGYTAAWISLLCSLGATALGLLGFFRQLRRNAYAYRGGRPPRTWRRTPRPIRPAQEGEVHPAEGYHGTLGRMVQPTQSYRMFRKLKP